MAIRYIHTNRGIYGSSTSRYIFVPTTTLTQIIISSGYTGIRMYNSGTNTLIWGDSSISTNSGNFLFPSQAREWENVQDRFNFYMTADSANSYISLTEFI